jgi:hypothetical protein
VCPGCSFTLYCCSHCRTSQETLLGGLGQNRVRAPTPPPIERSVQTILTAVAIASTKAKPVATSRPRPTVLEAKASNRPSLRYTPCISIAAWPILPIISTGQPPSPPHFPSRRGGRRERRVEREGRDRTMRLGTRTTRRSPRKWSRKKARLWQTRKVWQLSSHSAVFTS